MNVVRHSEQITKSNENNIISLTIPSRGAVAAAVAVIGLVGLSSLSAWISLLEGDADATGGSVAGSFSVLVVLQERARNRPEPICHLRGEIGRRNFQRKKKRTGETSAHGLVSFGVWGHEG